MADIFISYARSDRKHVDQISAALEAEGFTVWLDITMRAGETFDIVIERELDIAKCVVVVWSKTSVNREWVRNEAREGKSRGILVPVFIEDVKLPIEFRSIQTEDLSKWKGGLDHPQWLHFVDATRHKVETPSGEKKTYKLSTSKRFHVIGRFVVILIFIMIFIFTAYNLFFKSLTALEFRSLTAVEAASLRSGKMFQECKNCPEMVAIPAGQFKMGAPSDENGGWQDGREQPQIDVSIPNRFAISTKAISLEQFTIFAKATNFIPTQGCRSHASGRPYGRNDRNYSSPGFAQTPSHPVICVSWEDANAYVRWLSSITDAVYRLPSESEWEYVARAGSNKLFHFGDTWALLCEHGNIYDRTAAAMFGGKSFCTDGHLYTAPVGSFAPNDFGVYDVHGNVWEWVEDCWSKDHSLNTRNGQPVVISNCKERTQKGGDWIGWPQYNRSASRHFYGQTARGDNVGFRVVRELR